MPPSPELDIHQQFEFFMQRSMRGIMGSMKQDGLSMPQNFTRSCTCTMKAKCAFQI